MKANAREMLIVFSKTAKNWMKWSLLSVKLGKLHSTRKGISVFVTEGEERKRSVQQEIQLKIQDLQSWCRNKSMGKKAPPKED